MRLWTIHPKYLDAKGLVALWREALLALKVLEGKTKGYRHHPQLLRFRSKPNPIAYIAEYLREVHVESVARAYHFNFDKIPTEMRTRGRIRESQGQLDYEWSHFMKKIGTRQPSLHQKLKSISETQRRIVIFLLSPAISLFFRSFPQFAVSHEP